MEVWIGEDGTQLGDDVLGKLHGLGIGHVEHILADTAVYPYLGGTVGVAAVFGIGMQSSNKVTWHVHLGQNVYVALGGIAHDVLHLLLGVVEGTVFAICLCTGTCPIGVAVLLNLGDRGIVTATALGTDGGEERILLNLGTPALVVGQVPVEDVHLVDGHQVYHLLDFVYGKEVAADVQHKATVGKTGLVIDSCHGKRIGDASLAGLAQYHIGRQQAHEGLHGIVGALGRGGLYGNTVCGDVQHVALLGDVLVLGDGDVGISVGRLA